MELTSSLVSCMNYSVLPYLIYSILSSIVLNKRISDASVS